MKDTFLAVVNPAAGNGRCARLMNTALGGLRKGGLKIDVALTERSGHAVEIARKAYSEGYRQFIAVGGDGTSYEIVNGLFPEALNGDPPTLGFLPLGTGNSFLRDFTKEGVEYATRAILERRSRPCDVIKLAYRGGVSYYINILSFGFVADVCMLANRRFKRLGPLGYGLAVVLCLARFKRHVFPIRVDQSEEIKREETALLIFNNSKFTGGNMMLAPNAQNRRWVDRDR